MELLREFQKKNPYMEEIAGYLAGNEKLGRMFRNCFYSTVSKCAIWKEGAKPFVITGDIHAMWQRDSAEQVLPYVRLCKNNPTVKRFVCGVIWRQISNAMYDPYANAFNEVENNLHCRYDETEMKAGVWERKYEVDSPCHVVRLIDEYVKEMGELPYYSEHDNAGENTEDAVRARGAIAALFRRILELWKTEQRHPEVSPYRFTRHNTMERDSIHNGGLGAPVNYTGMTWSGFRPSDDASVFGYLIPSNFFAAGMLGKMKEIALEFLEDYEIAAKAGLLQEEILRGIRNYGIYRHPYYGRIYAYETDGFGNYVLEDDANVPSLLSLPDYSGELLDWDVYANTRKFVLSGENPNYVVGTRRSGPGSAHTPKDHIWPMGLALQALTSADETEIRDILVTLLHTDAGTGCMHESFHKDDPGIYTREHFSWADSVFARLVMKIYEDERLRPLLKMV